MNHTPHSNRLHIAIFGRRNSGKSSLVNALTGQDTALVSATPGTTTDPVTKAMEVYPLGSCLFIDTPGFDDDEGELGEMRVERTLKTVEKADVALLLYEEDGTLEKQWMDLLAEQGIPVIPILNKADSRRDVASLVLWIERECGRTPVVVSAKEGTGIQDIFDAILEKLPEDFGEQTITGGLVAEGDVVLLVMPQDIQAPKGRLILPQVQTIRELLDKKCLVMSCTTDKLQASLQALVRPPKLIITDSQVFPVVYRQKPAESSLTSFSVLFAGYKGNIHDFLSYFNNPQALSVNFHTDSLLSFTRLSLRTCINESAVSSYGHGIVRFQDIASILCHSAVYKDFTRPEQLLTLASGYII